MVEKRGEMGETLGQIKYSGEFDYESLYQSVYNWFKRKGYLVAETYKHKMTSSGAEVESTFKGDKKVTEFMKFKIEVEIKIWGLSEFEAMKEGKKQKLNKGRLAITFSWKLVLDYNSRFDKSEFMVRLFNFMRFTLLRQRIILVWSADLVAECYQLHTEIKRQLKMETAYSAW